MSAVLAFGVISLSNVANAEDVPGTLPSSMADKEFRSVPSAGLADFHNKYGRYKVEIGAKGSNSASHRISIYKPHSGAKVAAAYFLAASNFSRAIQDGYIKLNGKSVNWDRGVFNSLPNSTNFFHSVQADVKRIIRNKANSAGKGKISFKVQELQYNSNIDGEILVIVWEHDSFRKQTVLLYFGGLKTTGDQFIIDLRNKIRNSLDIVLSLGISFGYQTPSVRNQVSHIKVNGKQLTKSAGGQDDGGSYNGGLITVGSYKDKLDKYPNNPNAAPTNFDYDDEFYNINPLVATNATTVKIETVNPSNDDNIFFAAVVLPQKVDDSIVCDVE
jgi:hypothetical protein